MTPTLYLSRARLKRDASAAALAPLLLGGAGRGGQTRQPGHHLVWSLFADDPNRRRDFLWRETDAGVFLILSMRQPEDQHGLFEIAAPKPFAPALEPGDRLGFLAARQPCGSAPSAVGAPFRQARCRDGCAAIRAPGLRAAHRLATVRDQGIAWLGRQADMSGFTIHPGDVRVDGYDQRRIARKGSAPAMSYSTLDFEGVLTVTDPTTLLPAIARGFGAAKAYGCGLLLIRRVLIRCVKSDVPSRRRNVNHPGGRTPAERRH